MTEEATCLSCGKPFPKEHTWERQCIVCYKRQKGFELLRGDRAFEWAQDRLVEERRSGRKSRKAIQSTTAKELPELSDPKFLLQLISLCHPDKHPKNPKAEEITKKLLKLREEAKKR